MHLPIVLDNHVCERYCPLFVLIYLTTKKNKKKKKSLRMAMRGNAATISSFSEPCIVL